MWRISEAQVSTNEDGNDEQTQDSYGKPSACHLLYVCLCSLSLSLYIHLSRVSNNMDTQNTIITYYWAIWYIAY